MIHPNWKAYADWRELYLNNAETELIYLAAPYTRIEDKDGFMAALMHFSGKFMLENPDKHIVSPLFNHFSLDLVPGLAGDYAFWKSYSRNLLRRCDTLLVLTFPGWEESTGVQDEIKLATELKKTIAYVTVEQFIAI